MILELAADLVSQVAPVRIADEAIAKHAHDFVDPEREDLRNLRGGRRIAAQDALNHLGRVAQVESVVALGRCRKQLRPDGAVHGRSGEHQAGHDRL